MAATDSNRYFEFGATDRTLALLHEEAPFTLQLGLEFDGLLDHSDLVLAVELLSRRHPILTATIDLDAWPAHWQAGTTAPDCVEIVDDPGEGFASTAALAALQSGDLDAASGPTCQVVHLHDDVRSRLVFGVHHAMADARGIQLALDDLRRIHGALQRGERPTVDVDWNPRTLSALVDAQGPRLDERARRGWELAGRWGTVPRSTHVDAGGEGGAATARDPYDTTMQFDDALVCAVETGARSRGWRLNHVMLALLARAWLRVVGHEPVEPSVSGWLVTVDCRRQFRMTRGMGNLSGLEPVSVRAVDSGDVRDLIGGASAAFAPLARAGAGLAAEFSSPLARFTPPQVFDRATRDLVAMRTRTLRYSRLYSHTDHLPPDLAQWGTITAVGARWIPPRAVAAPYVAMVLVRFGGRTTITPFASTTTFPADCATSIAREMQSGLEEVASDL
jgi:hypothetical protein